MSKELPDNTDGWPAAVQITVPELVETGLLWLINTQVFHPRGFALGVDVGPDAPSALVVYATNGTEPVMFADESLVNQRYLDVEAFFAKLRRRA